MCVSNVILTLVQSSVLVLMLLIGLCSFVLVNVSVDIIMYLNVRFL
jgi:hypothetical protein